MVYIKYMFWFLIQIVCCLKDQIDFYFSRQIPPSCFNILLFFFYFCCCYFVSFNFDRLKNVWNSGFQKLKTYKRTKSKLEQPFAILRLDINDSKETKIVIGKKNSWHETSTRKYLQIHQNLWALPWNIWAITQNIWAIH